MLLNKPKLWHLTCIPEEADPQSCLLAKKASFHKKRTTYLLHIYGGWLGQSGNTQDPSLERKLRFYCILNRIFR